MSSGSSFTSRAPAHASPWHSKGGLEDALISVAGHGRHINMHGRTWVKAPSLLRRFACKPRQRGFHHRGNHPVCWQDASQVQFDDRCAPFPP